MAELLDLVPTPNGTNGTRRRGGGPRPPVSLGVTGLYQSGGYVQEEWLRSLQRDQGLRVFREMADNDPVIGASLGAISYLVRQVTWSVSPGVEDDPIAQDYADWTREALFEDLAQPWDALLQEILTMLWAGWSFHEVLYKRRLGWTNDPWTRSKFTDGQWGWHSLPIRAPESLERWVFDEATGALQAMIQRDPTDGRTYTIPVSKAALFRPSAHKGNPHGRSLLRNVYTPWFFSKRIEQLQAIGIERDLAGLPVMYVPPEILDPTLAQGDDSLKALYTKIVTNIRRGEQEGVVLPLQYDEQGNMLYKLELLSTGGQRQFDTTKVLEFYNKEKALALFTDVLLLGHEKVGSFALADSKTNLLGYAVGAICASIAEVFTGEIFPGLWSVNGFPPEMLPRLTPGDIETVDLTALGDFVTKYAQAGLDLSDLENEIRRRAGWPLKEDEAP